MRSIRGATALLLALFATAAATACAAPAAPHPGTPAILRVGFGTGFFVADGVIATADHVVRGCRRIDVWSGVVRDVQAAVMRRSRRDDVALLRVPVAAPVALGAAAMPARSGPLRAYGYPGAAAGTLPAEADPLLVNDRARADTPADPAEILWLQDAAIGHGWSGGPVIDGSGQVAGMVIAVMPDPASAGAVLDAPLPGIAIAAGLAALHLPPSRARTSLAAAPNAVVHVRCVE
jgi:S1-C subfamily serine protease